MIFGSSRQGSKGRYFLKVRWDTFFEGVYNMGGLGCCMSAPLSSLTCAPFHSTLDRVTRRSCLNELETGRQ